MWLQGNVPGIIPATAYDQARKEFYKLRLQEDVQRRVAQEEALSTGAYFHKSTMEVGMELEDRQYEEWKAWAVKEVQLAEQRRNAMYTGQESQSTDLSPEEEEAAVDEVGDAVPAQGQSAAGGATVIPASQGPGATEG
jgi:small subunit ribosomal protein S23